MMVQLVEELTIRNVLSPGIPNAECIAIQAVQGVNLGQFGLMLGMWDVASNAATPLQDALLWFGEAMLNPRDWLFVYTGPGQVRSSPNPHEAGTMYTVHWGRKQTIFHAPMVVPILFRVDAVHIPPPALRQLPLFSMRDGRKSA